MEKGHLIIGTCDQCSTKRIKLLKDPEDGLYRCLSCRAIHERKKPSEQMERDREKTKRRFNDWTQ